MAFAREGVELEIEAAADTLLGAAWSPAARRAWLRGRDRSLPASLWREVTGAGWLDIFVAEADGGLGLTVVEACAVAEAVGRHLAPGPIVDAIVLGLALSGRAGASPAVVVGPSGRAVLVRGCVDARDLRGDWVSAAASLAADCGDAIVLADAGDERVQVRALESLDRVRAPAAVDLDGAAVTAVLASGAEAARLRARIEVASRLMRASELLGVSEAAFGLALDHARERRQFGRPIGSFQAVRHRLAGMRVTIESMRSLGYLAQIAARDGAEDAAFLAAAAKAHASAGAREVAESALQVHGGIGFTADHDLSLYVLRGLSLQSALGDDTTLSRSIGRDVLGLEAPRAGDTEADGTLLEGVGGHNR